MDEFRQIPIDDLHESPLNPRRHWNAQALEELTASIRQRGVLTPLLARPNGKGFEIAAGHRRLRAARAAGVTELPVRVRDLDDAAFHEILCIENLQRDDVHPLDEAAGYAALMKADKAYTPEAIGAKVGKSTSYVYQRLKLLQLSPDCWEAFETDAITAAHAVRLARLTSDQQAKALEECFHPLFRGDRESREPAPVSQLDKWIDSHVRIDLTAPDTQHYFPELAEQVAVERETGSLLELSESHHVNVDLKTKKHGAIGRGRWTPITSPKNRCDHVQRGVIIHGGPMRILEVCATKGCSKHFPERKASTGASSKQSAKQQEERARQEQQRQREEAERKAWDALLPRALQAFAAHVSDLELTPALFKATMPDYRVKQIEKLTGPIKAKNLGQAAAVAIVVGETWSRSRFLGAVKPFKFNLGAVEQGAAGKPQSPKPKAKATKRRGRG